MANSSAIIIRRLRGTTAFTPASLFSGGRDGVLDDLTTRFQDAAGTTPVAALDDPVALALDKSQGAQFGPELITNTELENAASDWPYSGNLTSSEIIYNSDSIKIDGVTLPDKNSVSQEIQCEVGKQYFVSFTHDGSIRAVRVATTPGGDDVVSREISSFFFVATATTHYIVLSHDNSSVNITYKSVSVRELPGNHFTQSSTSFRPLSKGTYDQYDGSDDRMAGVYTPTAAGTIIARFNGVTGGRYIYGSHDGSNGRCYLGLDASGKLAAGIGAQSTSTIVAGSDLRNEWHTGAVTWDGTTVKLYLDGAEIYSAAQSGSVNTNVDIYRGCINSNGTPAAFWDGGIGESLIIDRALTADEILRTTNKWST